MVLEALQVVGLSLGLLAWVGAIVTCAAPEWRKNSQPQAAIVGTSLRYDGLWLRCTVYVAGQTHCEGYTSTFFTSIQDVLQVCRGLMIAAIAVGFSAIFVTILGLKCVTVGGPKVIIKARVAMAGGFMFGLTGIFAGASVSNYAHHVVQEYYNPAFPKNSPMQLRFEYGYALYLGWATLVFGLLSAIVIISISFAIISGHQNYIETDTPNQSTQGHSYRPVSILQRIPAQSEGIQLQTLTNTNIPPVPPHRQVRIQKNGPIEKQDINDTNSLATSTDRQRRYTDPRRKQSDRNNRQQSGSVANQSRSDRSTTESSRILKSKKLINSKQDYPPSGLIRSLSGSLKQYL